jgi:Domain of unknown function (DUF4328)/Protein of unknown function (DUF2510)
VPGPPPPGWYRDPYQPAYLRWWDGERWTPHALLPDRPPLSQAPRVPAYAGRNERIGRLAMLVWAPVYLLYLASCGLTFGPLIRDAISLAEEASRSPSDATTPFPADSFALSTVSSLTGLLVWIPLVLLIIWTHRCVTTATALHLPTTREPLWAILGWILPVINLWFPYQSVRDCLPPDHPARREVLWWWLGYLAVTVGGVLLLVPASVIGTTPFVVVLAALAVVAAVTVRFGLSIARAIDKAHRDLSTRVFAANG